MKVNGKDITFKENTTLLDLLDKYELKKDRVVIEINLEIIDKDMYKDYILKENDVIELINFVGGG